MNTQDERIQLMIELHRKVNNIPDTIEVTKFTKINNAEIQNICFKDGPAYHRVMSNIQERLGKRIQDELKGKLETKEDLKKFHSILSEAYNLMQHRMMKYGNSWRVMKIEGIASLIMMKMDRIAELGESNAKTKDELIDTINYAVFALIKYYEKNKK